MTGTYIWGYRGEGEGFGWIYRSPRNKYPRPTGMIWKGGHLQYRWPIGPRPEHWHIMHEIFSNLSFLQVCRPLSTPAPTSIPERKGNQIQFFTYALN